MIARIWHGWTSRQDAEAYERHFQEDVLPRLRQLSGFTGASLLRREVGDEVEFVAITHFASMAAVRAFAGPDVGAAVIAPAARSVLRRSDERVKHYVVAVGT